MDFKPFWDLEIWKRAREFKNEIFLPAKKFPGDEKFRLVNQIIRSSHSINANLAESHGRFGYPDQIHFCIQARGSLNETYNHIIDAFDCHYIDQATLNHFKAEYEILMKLLNGYISYLRKLRDNL